MRKTVLQVAQNIAIGAFVGLSAYGILTYVFGGDEASPMPPSRSILLGLIAFGCMALIVVLGGLIDRESARGSGKGKKTEENGGPGPSG